MACSGRPGNGLRASHDVAGDDDGAISVTMLTPGSPSHSLPFLALSVPAVRLGSPRHVAIGFYPPAPAGVQCIGLLLRPVWHFALV